MAAKKSKRRSRKPPAHRHSAESLVKVERSEAPTVIDGRGNATRLTPELQRRFQKDLEETGDFPTMVALRHQIGATTFKHWLRLGCEEGAVEPYVGWVRAIVESEGQMSGALVKVLLDRALGRTKRAKEDSETLAPDTESAKWLLVRRFSWLWAENKEHGGTRGQSLAQLVTETILEANADRREKALRLLSNMNNEFKEAARSEGFHV